MKFIMFVKASEQSEAGILPEPELFKEMAQYNQSLADAKVLLSLDGLHPSSDGARVTFADGKTTVTDGPFANPQELVAGYWLIQVSSKAEAIEWAKRVPFKEGVVEVRQVQDVADFPPEIQQALASEFKSKL